MKDSKTVYKENNENFLQRLEPWKQITKGDSTWKIMHPGRASEKE